MLSLFQIPHKVQEIMAGESLPILSGAIPVVEMFMAILLKINADHRHLQPFIKPGLEWCYRYYARMDHTRAYVIAMCKQIHFQN